jgi:hypothetical protein
MKEMKEMSEARGGHFENEVDRPKPAKGDGKAHNLESLADFKGQAMDTAYGQSGKGGLESDMKKIHSQFHHCYDDPGSSGY